MFPDCPARFVPAQVPALEDTHLPVSRGRRPGTLLSVRSHVLLPSSLGWVSSLAWCGPTLLLQMLRGRKERERHRVSLRRGSNREGENAAEKDLCGATRAAWPAGRSRAAGVPARDPMGAHLSHATCSDPRHMKAAPSAGLLQLLSEQQNVKRSGLVNRSGSTCPSALAKLAKGS